MTVKEGSKPAAYELARFAREMRFDDVPINVRERVKDIIIDQFGIQLACATLPWSKTLLHVIQELGGNPVCTVAYYGMKTSPEHAAFCNGSFGHGFEIDDIHLSATNHPGCLGIATTMAMGEWVHANGKELITTAALTMELMLRITQIAATALLQKGKNTHPPTAPFALAAGAARLLGLDQQGIMNAASLGGSYSLAGLREYTVSGGTLKRTYGGLPSQIGIRSAFLAKHGISGPPTILEGRWGLFKVVCGLTDPDLRPLTSGLGQDWLLMGTIFKRHAACYFLHTAIEACLKLRSKGGFVAADVDSVTLGASDVGIRHTGGAKEPKDVQNAQFSLAFAAASVLVKGSFGFYEDIEKNLSDPEVLSLSRRVQLVVDPQADSEYPSSWPSRVTIHLKDGRQMSEYVSKIKGDVEDPLTREDLKNKFRDLTAPLMSQMQQDRIVSAIENLEQLRDVAQIMNQLVVR